MERSRCAAHPSSRVAAAARSPTGAAEQLRRHCSEPLFHFILAVLHGFLQVPLADVRIACSFGHRHTHITHTEVHVHSERVASRERPSFSHCHRSSCSSRPPPCLGPCHVLPPRQGSVAHLRGIARSSEYVEVFVAAGRRPLSADRLGSQLLSSSSRCVRAVGRCKWAGYSDAASGARVHPARWMSRRAGHFVHTFVGCGLTFLWRDCCGLTFLWRLGCGVERVLLFAGS